MTWIDLIKLIPWAGLLLILWKWRNDLITERRECAAQLALLQSKYERVVTILKRRLGFTDEDLLPESVRPPTGRHVIGNIFEEETPTDKRTGPPPFHKDEK